MKKLLAVAVLTVLVGVPIAGIAYASTLKTWTTHEALTSTDLNSNFAHIHTTMVGGHGARLTNSDVSSSAAIAHTKMATPGLLPKAWVMTGSGCTGDGGSSQPCTISKQWPTGFFSGVTYTPTGEFRFTFTYARADAVYFAVPILVGGAAPDCSFDLGDSTVTYARVICTASTGSVGLLFFDD